MNHLFHNFITFRSIQCLILDFILFFMNTVHRLLLNCFILTKCLNNTINTYKVICFSIVLFSLFSLFFKSVCTCSIIEV